MSPTGGRATRTRAITIALVVAAMAAGFAWFVVPRDRSTAIDVDDALDRYRSSSVPQTLPTSAPAGSTVGTGTVGTGTVDTGTVDTTVVTTNAAPSTTAPAALSLPDAGVYRYDTTGFESIDALGGVRHDYPAVSTITVTDDGATGGCGRSLRWDVLEERYETWGLCLESGAVVWQPTSLQYHEFFEQETPEHVVCDVAVPLTDPAVGVVRQDCRLADRPWAPSWEHLGLAERIVEGTVVPVHHVRMIVDDTDELPESYVQDWFVRSDGLPVEVTVEKRSVNPNPIGGVVEYRESYRITLLTLDPLR